MTPSLSTKPLLLTLDDNTGLRTGLERCTQWEPGACSVRHFPDGESYVRILSACAQRDVIIQCGLHAPDRKIMALLFCAATLKELGARSVGLVAPYLAYMRQDCRFHEGEAVSSRLFAQLVSHYFDWLITVDPHLHRHRELGEIYSIPARAISSTASMARWIREHVDQPLLIGPDSESEQWVSAVARLADAPFLVLNKIRRGDNDVQVSVPDVEKWRGHTPVLVDDIISTGHTLLETLAHLRHARMRPAVCVAAHGLFSDSVEKKLGACEKLNTGKTLSTYEQLLAGGADRIVTTNSVPHDSNAIDLSDVIAAAVDAFLTSHTPAPA